MEQCTITPPKRQRRKESLIRKDGKADVEQCVRAWNTYRKSHAKPSVREFARLIGEAPSTVRYILNKGTSAGHLAHYLPNQKRWDYYELSSDFAIEETKKRAANKGPVCQVTNFFVIDFEKAYAKTKSVTYALQLLSEAPHDYHLPSRSTVYRLLERGELLDKHGKPLTYKRYKRPLHKSAPTDHPRNHAPKHMIDELSSAAREHSEPGHFQMDTVHSAGGCSGMLTLVDPYCSDPSAPRRFYMYFLPSISQAAVTAALRRFRRDLRTRGHELKTILTDNGSEFLHEDTLEHLLHVPIYYCHPYSAWEKGSIERHNRLLRTYYPKSTDFAKLTPRALKQTQVRFEVGGETGEEGGIGREEAGK